MQASLRSQLTLYFVLFAGALGLLFTVVTLIVFHRVEDRMVARRLGQMLMEGDTAAQQAFYVGPPTEAPGPFPRRLQALAPGRYEWEDDGRESHALLVEDDSSGGRRVAIANFPEAEVAETRLVAALLMGVAITSALAMLLARYLAAKIVSPIEQLSKQLEQKPSSGAVNTHGASAIPRLLAFARPGLERQDEIGTLARALHLASEELKSFAERERSFLREASHELRTPISVIQGVADLLRESIPADDRLSQQRLERLGRSLRRMNTSVLSLLAMARAEHQLSMGELPPFAQQLDDLVNEARSLAPPGTEIRSQLQAQPQSQEAAAMLSVVLANLTRNAVEHAPGAAVEVVVERERAQVIDQGPGLPPALLHQIQGQGPRPDLGIGLATVLRICQRLGWQFSVECPPGGGTVATVELLHQS